MDEVDFTVLAATSVFTDLMEKCPPAEACRDAFDRTVKATVKMANSTGGFGQTLNSKNSRGSMDRQQPQRHQDHRIDWSSSRADSASQQSSTGKRQHQHRGSIDQLAAAAAAASDLGSVSDAYSNSASSISQLSAFAKQQQQTQFRFKNEPSESGSGFSMMRNLPLPPRSNASTGSGVENSNLNTIGSQAGTPDAIDPSLMGSPVVGQMSSPTVGMAPPSFPQQPDTVFGFGDMQGIDFLQGLEGSTGAALDGGGPDFGVGDQMDLGFGLGWEGLHHDFSEGQQVDLFDGFFFGGQQGNGGSGMGGGL